MRGISEGTQAIQQLAKTIGNYITGNTQITYSWIGANPSGTPDPVVSFTASLKGTVSLITPTGVPDLCMQLSIGIKALTVTPGDSTFVVPLVLNPGGTVSITLTPSEDTFEKAMNALAAQIVSSMQSYLNPTPIPGSHGAFTGTAVMTALL